MGVLPFGAERRVIGDMEREVELDDMLEALRDQLRAAQRQRDLASDRFDTILHQVPRGLPNPDSTELVRQASREYRRMQQELVNALERLNEYLVHGKIPAEIEARSRRDLADIENRELVDSELVDNEVVHKKTG
jgi:uncharacterized protein YPO0396